jgi:ferredoxin
MTYIVTENCIKCKHGDCMEVCPVACFYEGENMVVINPEECIDCGVCEPYCPVDAIIPDNRPGVEKWVELNQKYAQLWPRVTKKTPPLADPEKWDDVPDKLRDHFSPNPGKGDRS